MPKLTEAEDRKVKRVRAVFSAGLRGDPFPNGIEQRLHTLKKLLSEANEDWELALLKEARPGRSKRVYEEKYEEMEAEKGRFLKGDPLSLLRCFIMSVELGLTPPQPVLDALCNAFRKVLHSNGSVKLDRLLGLTGVTKGERTAFRKAKSYDNQLWLASVLFFLTEGFGLTVAEAAERLSFFLESHPEIAVTYETDSLVQQYSKWRKAHFSSMTPSHPDHPCNWSTAFKARFLQRFKKP